MLELLVHVNGEELQIFYGMFTINDQIRNAEKNRILVEEAILEKFAKCLDPQYIIRQAIDASLDKKNLAKALELLGAL